MRMKSKRNVSLLADREREYSENVYRTRWQPVVFDPDEFERRYSISLCNGGTNLRFRAYKAQFDFLAKNEGPYFLDCACGAGQLSIWLAQQGKKVWAFDFSESAIDIAKKSAEISGVDKMISYELMDARHLQYEDEFFDIITGKDCIHHLIKFPDAIREMVRVLKTGGKAVFVEPLALNPIINVLRFINIYFNKRLGEHMLNKSDLKFLECEFGSIQLDHFSVFSTFSKLIPGQFRQVAVIKRLCVILDMLDVYILKRLPFLNHYASVCYMELTKTSKS